MQTGKIVLFLAVVMCVIVLLVSCENKPAPKPTAQPQVSPLASPAQTPAAGAPSQCAKGCFEVTEECKIKGVVIGAGDKYYYTPDMPGYREARVLIQFNGRWFCTVDEAANNGFKKAPAQ